MEIMNIKFLEFCTRGDENGSLIALEQNINIPFEIKRVYYIFDTKNDFIRGKHAHPNLEQVLVAVNGCCTIMVDDGKEKQEINLNSRCQGLYLGRNIWREMYNFSDDCVLMVLASELYDKDEYVFDYGEFLKCVE